MFQINPFIYTQVYKTKNKVRAVLENALDQEYLEFEDDTALLWDAMLNKKNFNSIQLAQELNKPKNEIEKFIEELVKINIISSTQDKILNQAKNNKKKDDKNLSNERFSNGGYLEPAPGGSNILEEYDLMEWVTKNGFLYSTGWELTYRCNERCVHCFNPGASHVEGDKSFRKVDEVETKKIFETLDKLKSLGVFRMLLTGGELFLRKDLFEILHYINKLRISYTIFTNGTLLDEKKIKKISSFYPSRVELSIYSSKAEDHDDITRLKYSWLKTVKSAKLFKKYNITTSLKMIAMKNTINDVKNFEKFCDENDFEYSVDHSMSPGVDGNSFPIKNLLPKAKDLIMESLRPSSPLYVGTIEKPKNYDPKNHIGEPVCGAGRHTMNITSEGNISPCNSLPLTYGNIKNDNIDEIWKNSSVGKKEKAKYNKEKSLSGSGSEKLSSWQGVARGDYDVCGDFKRCGWCQKCPGLAYLETGSELKPSTTNCRNSAARMIAFDLLKDHKTLAEILNKYDESLLEKKYNLETALWDPLSNIEKQKDPKLRSIIRERTKPTALEKLLKAEGLSQ